MAELSEKQPPTYPRKEARIPFFLLLFYLLLEYGRPQDQIPFLSVLHLPAITIVILLLFILASGNLRLKGKQAVLFLGLLVLMVVHGPIAVNNYWTLMIFITMTINFIVFLSLTLFVDNREKYERLMKVWLGIHVLLAVVGAIKGSGRGIGGFLGDENDFCMTMNMILPFPFFLAMYEGGRKRILYLGLTLMFLFVIIMTQSRGGFVGLIATSIYCWARTKKKVLTTCIVGLLAVFVFLVAPPTYWKEVRSIQEEGASKGTGAERVYIWKVGWQMFLDNPILGVGQGNYPFAFGKYERSAATSSELYHGRSRAGRVAHSLYFTLLSELGVVGMLIFLGILYACIKDLNYLKSISLINVGGSKMGTPEKHKIYAFALEGSLVSFLASGIFISILYYPNFWIFMGFLLSLKYIVMQGVNGVSVSPGKIKEKGRFLT